MKIENREQSYDVKCSELAQHFLEGDEQYVAISTTRDQEDLAQEIQNCIENWIQKRLDDFEPRQDPPGWEAGFAKNH